MTRKVNRFTKAVLTVAAAGLLLGLLLVTKRQLTDDQASVSESATSGHEVADERPALHATVGSTENTAPASLSEEHPLPHAAVLSNSTRASVMGSPRQSTKDQQPLPFIDSPVAETWLREEGITRADIETAQARLSANGFPERMREDPSLIRQFLPRRDIQAAHVRSFSIAAHARSGEAIPFSMGGALPDSSFSFTHFDISMQSNLIRILPVGSTTGETAPGEEIPVNLDGELPPLTPGSYRIEFPELGPDGVFQLIVD